MLDRVINEVYQRLLDRASVHSQFKQGVRGMIVRGMGKQKSSGWVVIPLTTIPLTIFSSDWIMV